MRIRHLALLLGLLLAACTQNSWDRAIDTYEYRHVPPQE
jgi:hypothetical protein